jgi:hypothetical protein
MKDNCFFDTNIVLYAHTDLDLKKQAIAEELIQSSENGFASTLLDIFHATPQSSQRLMPIDFDNQCVASVAALRETKMSSSVVCEYTGYSGICQCLFV